MVEQYDCQHYVGTIARVDGGIGIPANLVGVSSFLAGPWGLHNRLK